MSTAEEHQPAEQQAPLIPDATLPFICHYLLKHGKLYLASFLLITLSATCTTLLPWAIGNLVRGVSTSSLPPEKTYPHLYLPLLYFILLSLSELLLNRFSDQLQVFARLLIRQRVMRDLFHYVQHHDHRYLSEHFSGSLAFRINEVAMGLFHLLFMAINDFWPMLIVLTISIILMFHTNLTLALLFFSWATLFILISAWLATHSQRHFANSASARSATSGFVIDSVTNLGNTKLFARENAERAQLEMFFATERKEIGKANQFNQNVRWFQGSAAAMLKVGTLWLALWLWSRAKIDLSAFVMVTTLTFPVINETRNLGRRLLDFSEHLGSVQSGIKELIQPHGITDALQAKELDQVRGEIHLQDVCFSYPSGAPVFQGLNLHIPAGQKVGIVGQSGSGKSSLVALLLRLYDPQSGKVLIDQQDLQQLTQSSIRRHIALIPQDPQLFHRTIGDNIGYGKEQATAAQIEAAAKAAFAHPFIAKLKDGYHTLIGERGVKLSGGQRQRIAIARAMVKEAPILILDEATSALDSITEKAIQNTLAVRSKKSTLLVIAHRLSTITDLDRILVFRDGTIVEDGTHEQLLKMQGEYAALWQVQASPAPCADQESIISYPPENRPMPRPNRRHQTRW